MLPHLEFPEFLSIFLRYFGPQQLIFSFRNRRSCISQCIEESDTDNYATRKIIVFPKKRKSLRWTTFPPNWCHTDGKQQETI